MRVLESMSKNLGTILLVDDDINLRFVLAAQLKNAGFTVIEASDGEQAVALANKHLPVVIVMDLAMPNMDGLEATRILKSTPETTSIPIIILTGSTKKEDLINTMESGAQDYLNKPLDMTEFIARVRTVHRLALAHNELDELNDKLENEIEIKTERLEYLNKYVQNLCATNDREKVLDMIIDALKNITTAKRISILLHNERTNNLECVRAEGIPQEVAEKISTTVDYGISGQVYRTGSTLAASSYNSDGDSRYESNYFICTPLEISSESFGVINITEKDNGTEFTPEEVEFVRSIADTAAITLDSIRKNEQLERSLDVMLQTLGHLAEYRDEETTLHLDRVQKLTEILAYQLASDSPYAKVITQEFIDHLVQAAPLHDLGKVGIPDNILTKPGKLTNEEFEIMKKHTIIAKNVLERAMNPSEPSKMLRMCIDIAYCHHEKYNGMGYPTGKRAEDIPLAARIVALVDAYDAITSKRRYKDEKSHEQAVDIIKKERGQHFDPVIVDEFMKCEKQFDQIREKFGDTSQTLNQSMIPNS